MRVIRKFIRKINVEGKIRKELTNHFDIIHKNTQNGKGKKIGKTITRFKFYANGNCFHPVIVVDVHFSIALCQKNLLL